MRYCQVCHRCFGDRVEYCLFDQALTRVVESLPLLIEGKYRLERMIAGGGMGTVYRALHLSLDRPVAIKILRQELLSDARLVERFHREARAAARLKHPNIVAIYDYGVLDSGSAYLVMELIEGRSLREEIRSQVSRYGRMSPARAAGILSQICAGVEAAHQSGIIHRDLKPDNIMIETTSQGAERVLVLDFGIAKLKAVDPPWPELTEENSIIGTPHYISPEQSTGGTVDARSDVYSLGLILYEMLTGRVPFTGPNTSVILLKHLREIPTAPSRFTPDLDPEVERLTLKALAKNPEDRFGSAAEFGRALEAVSRRLGLQDNAADETRPRQLPEPEIFTEVASTAGSRPPRRAFLLSLGLAGLAAAGGVGYLWSSHSEAQSETPDPASEESPLPAPTLDPALDLKLDVLAAYRQWTQSAIRGEWDRHLRLYADRVDYFRDGKLTRARIAERKRQVFRDLDSYTLRFSESPAINIDRLGTTPEATVWFDRQWVLRKRRKQVRGQARGILTLRLESPGWRIVSERQIK